MNIPDRNAVGILESRDVAVGIDVGGTFTDLAALGTDGRIVTA